MALAYGMTAEQYFFQDPNLFESYKNAFEMKREMEDWNLWFQGAYFKKALESTAIWAYGAVDSNKMKLEEYPKQPLTQIKKDKEEIVDKETLKRERFKAYAYFDQVHKSNLKRQRK